MVKISEGAHYRAEVIITPLEFDPHATSACAEEQVNGPHSIEHVSTLCPGLLYMYVGQALSYPDPEDDEEASVELFGKIPGWTLSLLNEKKRKG